MLARYAGRRLGQSAFVLWLAATFAFVALQLAPGDPAQALLSASGATPDQIAERRAQLGLDDHPLVQYVRYLTDLARADLGESWLHGRPASQMVLEQLGPTVQLSLAATVIGTLIGVTLGVAGGACRSTWIDSVATALAAVGLSTPVYWSGTLAIALFSVHLGWLPATGGGRLDQLVLPALVLGFALAGPIARLVRVRVIELMQEDFVVAARARGLPAWRVILIHVLRPAIPPALTVVALQAGFLLGGAVVTETVFARPGLGALALQAILWRDMPVVRAVVLSGAIAYVLANLLADIARMWLNPRLLAEEG
jgi:peptide/nickel transport system permease protein